MERRQAATARWAKRSNHGRKRESLHSHKRKKKFQSLPPTNSSSIPYFFFFLIVPLPLSLLHLGSLTKQEQAGAFSKTNITKKKKKKIFLEKLISSFFLSLLQIRISHRERESEREIILAVAKTDSNE